MAKKNYKQIKDELEQVIEKLQDEQLDVDEALELYEKAQRLATELEKYLAEAKHRFSVLKKK